MTCNNFYIFCDSNLYFYGFLLSFLIIVISKYWRNFFNKISIFNTYNTLQKTHESETSRLGGLIFWLVLSLYLFFGNLNENIEYFLGMIFLSSIPFLIIGVKEDIFHNTSPTIRLISMFLSTLIYFIFVNPELPNIDIFLFSSFFTSAIFLIPFYVICIITLMNGMNVIDGSNGVLLLTAIMQLLSITFLSLIFNDYFFLNISLLLIFFLSITLFFNFPKGMIFSGDFGAYFFGFLNSIIIISFFGKHQNIASWLGVLIVFYPVMEIIFSYLRKILTNKSPFKPDLNHIHLRLFHILKIKNSSYVSNNYIVIFLLPLILLPLIFLLLFYDSMIIISCSIIFLILIYFTYYLILKKIQKK